MPQAADGDRLGAEECFQRILLRHIYRQWSQDGCIRIFRLCNSLQRAFFSICAFLIAAWRQQKHLLAPLSSFLKRQHTALSWIVWPWGSLKASPPTFPKNDTPICSFVPYSRYLIRSYSLAKGIIDLSILIFWYYSKKVLFFQVCVIVFIRLFW